MSSAIKQLKNGKSAGPDSAPEEALNADVETSVELLHPPFSKIREEEKIRQSGKRVTSTSFSRKATSVSASTTEKSHC
ncbi:hypothetical protein DPMN_113658 [Dreissena polymorpha]|uniref:Uncharacterized protein n=1 Tax=Dreissena polymorpha TaxID=45954 RepID=A0A9D4KIN6_DREPO|nr:hypothetical protein DPMN_113658 [Dreissena polymorpha]